MKTILFFIAFLALNTSIAQIQIGQDIDGLGANNGSGPVSMSEDGTRIVIGAPVLNSGNVRVFEQVNGSWNQIGQTLVGVAYLDFFGTDVSMSADGKRVAIGGPNYSANGFSAGHVRIYEEVNGTWNQIGQDINGEAAGDYSGEEISMSADGKRVIIGAWYNTGNGLDAGHARIYEEVNGTWIQIGQDIDGEAAGDNSGSNVAISADGTIVAIGAWMNDGNGSNSGHTRVYKDTNGTWTQIGQDIDGEATGDLSGIGLSLSAAGTRVAIGAIYNSNNGVSAGHTRIYEEINGNWMQVGQDIDGEAGGDRSGCRVSISADGTRVVIGAPDNNGSGFQSGHARIYEEVNGVWVQFGQDIDGEFADDRAGKYVFISADGSTVAVGATGNDGNGSNAGHVRVFKLDGTVQVDTEIPTSEQFTAYPNPTDGQIYIDLNNEYSTITVSVSDVAGRMLSKELYQNVSIIELDIHQPAGIYFVDVVTESVNNSFKISKE